MPWPKFTEFLNKSDYIYNVVRLKYDIEKHKIVCFEKIIYYRALELSRMGASKEFLGDIANAKILYIWSYRLFKSLTYDVISQFDKTVIDGFMIKIKERINECCLEK